MCRAEKTRCSRTNARNVPGISELSPFGFGQIVSDNTISRAVVVQRKELQDDGTIREYAAKVRLSLLADVAAAEKPQVTAQTDNRM